MTVKCKLFCLAALLLLPVMAHAKVVDPSKIDEYVEELNAMCPLIYDNDWVINSVTSVGTNYELVDIEMPAVLSMFFPTLTQDAGNVKQLWNRQLKHYGSKWDRLVDLAVAADRRIVLYLHTRGGDQSAFVTLYPSDFDK